MANQNFLNALQNESLANAIANKGFQDLLSNDMFLRALGNQDFANALSSQGFAERLQNAGVKVTRVKKIAEGHPNLIDYLKNDDVQLILNTPSGNNRFARPERAGLGRTEC